MQLVNNRVGNGFWVYGIQGSYKPGIWYLHAEIWVFSISFVLLMLIIQLILDTK